jgi:hypothetical protein
MIAALTSLVVASTLAGAPPPAPPVRPVRVWVDPANFLAPGDPARVYVHTEDDGNLVVLLARVDGGVTVLFPPSPAGDPFVKAGTYEIQGPGESAAFIASGPSGRGMVLAAVSPDPVWFDEFVAGRSWNEAALTGSGAALDPEGALTDIIQRMLGAGSFSYDAAPYVVVPLAAPAPSPTFSLDQGAPEAGDYVQSGEMAYYPDSYFPDYYYPYYDVAYVVANRINCRWLNNCGTVSFGRHERPSVIPAPPTHAVAMYTRNQPTGAGAPVLVAQPRPRATAAPQRVGAPPRSRSVVAAERTAPAPVPAPLVARSRPRSEVATVAVARQRVLQRQARPAALGAPLGGTTAALVPNAPRGRVNPPLTAARAPAAAVMMRAPFAAPLNVRGTAGAVAAPGGRVGAPTAQVPTAQTFALPHVPPRLYRVR